MANTRDKNISMTGSYTSYRREFRWAPTVLSDAESLRLPMLLNEEM